MFCESLAEFLKLNRSIKILDISCNFIDDSNAATLKASLEGNPNIIELDVRNNQLSDETEEEINEIITKNFLASKNIPFKKLGEYADKGGAGGKEEAPKDEGPKVETKAAAVESNAGGDSPNKVEDEGADVAE
jgi:hypothetical protein